MLRAARRLAFPLALSLATTHDAAAQENATSNSRRMFSFGVTAISSSIATSTASAQRVGSRAWGLQVDGGLMLGRFLYLGADAGGSRLDDQAGFNENTTVGERSSSAALLHATVLAGPRIAAGRIVPALRSVQLGVFAGYSATSSERSIGDCVDCTVQSISIEGGTFLQPTVVIGQGRVRARLSDRLFVGGDGVRSTLAAGLEIGR